MRRLKPITNLDSYADFFIGSQVKTNGYIQTEEDVYLDGEFEGRLITQNLLEIGPTAKVSAKLSCRALIIKGLFNGTAEVQEEVILGSSAVINAALKASQIEIEKGANFTGNILMPRL